MKYLINLFIVTLFICNQTIGYSQKVNHQTIDSILTLVHKQDTDSLKISLHRLGYLLVKEAPNEAQSYFEYLFKKDSSAIVKLMVYEFYAKNLASLGLTDEALKLRREGLELSKEFKDISHEIYYNIAISDCYIIKNELDKSLNYLNIAESLAIETNTLYLLNDVYTGKTSVYTILRDFDKAYDYYIKIWNILKDEKNTPNKRYNLYVIVNFLSLRDKPKELIFFTEELAKLYNDETVKLPKGHFPLKGIFEKRIDPKQIPRYKEIVRISDSLNSFTTFYYSSDLLAQSFRANQQPLQAINVLKKTITKFKTIERPNQLMNLYTTLSEMYVETNDYKNAFKTKELENELRNKISSEKMQKNISELEIKYDTERKNKEIIQQQLEIKDKENEIQKKNTQNNYIMRIAFFLLIASILTWIVFQQRQKRKNQEIVSLKREHQINTLESLMEGEEKERFRLAKELHDGVNGDLSAIKHKLNTLLELNNKTIEQAVVMIDKSCEQVRAISHNLVPPALEKFNLQTAASDYCANMNNTHPPKIDFNYLGDSLSLPKKVEINIFRIIQELITNSLKHAEASEISVQLSLQDKILQLVVEDNGIGFDTSKSNFEGIGILNLKSRVAFLNAEIDFESSNQGTSVNVLMDITKYNND